MYFVHRMKPKIDSLIYKNKIKLIVALTPLTYNSELCRKLFNHSVTNDIYVDQAFVYLTLGAGKAGNWQLEK